MRWCAGGGPFQSNWAPIVHSGLPEGAEEVEVIVTWPDGVGSTHVIPARSRVVIERGDDGFETSLRAAG